MKLTTFVSIIVLTLIFFGCSKEANEKELVIGATPVPHAQLLNLVKDDLEKKGITLKIVEFTDYVTPNIALNEGQLDMNFFQHQPYMESFSEERNLNLQSFGTIHVEPLGLYSEKYNDVNDLPDGATIGIPNDAINGGRALLLLESNGLITLDKKAGLKANERDIQENPHNYEIKALEAAQLPRVLQDLDCAIINGNFALEAGLNPLSDSLLLEDGNSPYANILTIRAGEEGNRQFKILLEALQSNKVRKYMFDQYKGGVVPAF